MRYTLHVPVEQFGYIEAEAEMTPEIATKLYKQIKTEFNKKEVDKIAKVVAKEKAKLDGDIDAIDYQPNNE